jgi:hypothetical protein
MLNLLARFLFGGVQHPFMSQNKDSETSGALRHGAKGAHSE